MSKDKRVLTQAIMLTTKEICGEVAEYLDIEFEDAAVDLVTELVLKMLEVYGSDLEAFTKHAKRSTITCDDVFLLVRQNESLKELLDVKFKDITGSRSSAGLTTVESGTKRKRSGEP